MVVEQYKEINTLKFNIDRIELIENNLLDKRFYLAYRSIERNTCHVDDVVEVDRNIDICEQQT
jgi:hypothetical protein